VLAAVNPARTRAARPYDSDMNSSDPTPDNTPNGKQAPNEPNGDDGLADSIRSIRGVGESRTGADADDA
jgi:hypothetical protein